MTNTGNIDIKGSHSMSGPKSILELTNTDYSVHQNFAARNGARAILQGGNFDVARNFKMMGAGTIFDMTNTNMNVGGNADIYDGTLQANGGSINFNQTANIWNAGQVITYNVDMNVGSDFNVHGNLTAMGGALNVGNNMYSGYGSNVMLQDVNARVGNNLNVNGEFVANGGTLAVVNNENWTHCKFHRNE